MTPQGRTMRAGNNGPLRVWAAAAIACLLFACASVEKRVDLTYERAVETKGGSGEVYLARPVVEVRLEKIPGRTVLGSVRNRGTQIVTGDDVSDWVFDALAGELRHAGYEIRRSPALPAGAPKGVVVRVVGLSADQQDKGVFLTTSSEMALSAEIWKNGRLSKTFTARVSSQDDGMDRSGEAVGSSLRKTLQSAMRELVPGVVDAL